ncbi:MAG: glutathione S-transferase family protein [Sphingobacteriales bacterium]
MGRTSYRGGVTDGDGKLTSDWRNLFARYSDRFMLGSDTWINERWFGYDTIFKEYRGWLAQARRIANGNALPLFRTAGLIRIPNGEKSNMKLYMHPVSITSRPVRLFAADNNIAMDEEVVDLFTGVHLQPPYSTINPNCLVPMLEDGDTKLTESSAILKYLADKIGSPAYPKDLRARAKVNEMMDWINTNFYREWGYNLCYPQLFPHLKRRSDEAQQATLEFGRENARRWLKLLNDYWLGPNKTYLCGDQITIADYFGSGIVTLGEIIRVDFTPYPNVKRWLDAMKKRPNWAKVNEAFYGLRAAVKEQKFVTLA